MKVQFNMVTMKAGKINVEEKPELSELLSQSMANILTDEVKRDKVLLRISEGAKFGTFRRFKTQQPFLVKAYKTRKGADQNTFWRNH